MEVVRPDDLDVLGRRSAAVGDVDADDLGVVVGGPERGGGVQVGDVVVEPAVLEVDRTRRS